MKILEYELKLLKDKETEEKAQMSSMDKFFSDGVPINNNILALKSMFRKSMNHGESQIKNLKGKAIEIDKSNQNLVETNEKLKSEIEQMEEDFDLMETYYLEKEEEFRMAIFEEKEKKRENELLLREQTNQNKKYMDQNLKINRRIEKEKILAPKKKESERIQLNTLKRQISERNKSKNY